MNAPPIPQLAPPRQLVLPFREMERISRQVDHLCRGDALICGRESLEYVIPVDGGSEQLRLYRNGRIVGMAYVRANAPKLKMALVPLLFERGWTDDCRIEVDAALRRRRTQRKMAKAG